MLVQEIIDCFNDLQLYIPYTKMHFLSKYLIALMAALFFCLLCFSKLRSGTWLTAAWRPTTLATPVTWTPSLSHPTAPCVPPVARTAAPCCGTWTRENICTPLKVSDRLPLFLLLPEPRVICNICFPLWSADNAPWFLFLALHNVNLSLIYTMKNRCDMRREKPRLHAVAAAHRKSWARLNFCDSLLCDSTCIATGETQVARSALAHHACFPLVALDLRHDSMNWRSLSRVSDFFIVQIRLYYSQRNGHSVAAHLVRVIECE